MVMLLQCLLSPAAVCLWLGLLFRKDIRAFARRLRSFKLSEHFQGELSDPLRRPPSA